MTRFNDMSGGSLGPLEGRHASELTDVEFAVLCDLSDDDYWLYEILWFINTQCPDMDCEDRLRLPQTTVLRLIDLSLLEAFWFDEHFHPVRPLTADEVWTELQEPSNWDPTQSMAAPPYLGCGMTESGWLLYAREFPRQTGRTS